MSGVELAEDCPEFKFIAFNPRRHSRGASAVKMECGDGWLWMSRKDVEANIRDFGPHLELIRAKAAYQRPTLEIREAT